MKILAGDSGDRDVGINPSQAMIDINFELSQFTEEDREQLRDGFKQFVKDFLYFEEPVNIYFDDECVECQALIVDGKCSYEDCVSNINQVEWK